MISDIIQDYNCSYFRTLFEETKYVHEDFINPEAYMTKIG